MGEVYLAEHALLRRPCALKLIHPERAGDVKDLLRFEREVQTTATLTHPNTVQIFDYGHAADGTFYYVMEYLPGLTLEQMVGQHGPLPPARAIHFLRQVCGALAEAHAIGLVHRDLKPGLARRPASFPRQLRNQGIGNLGGGRLSAAVYGFEFPGSQHILDCAQNAACGLFLTNVFQQVNGWQQEGQGIGPVGADGFARSAVESLENADSFADVDARRGADAADDARAQIADDVAVQVAHDHDVELLRLGHQLHAAVIDDNFLGLQFGEIIGEREKGLQVQPIGQLEDVDVVDVVVVLAVGGKESHYV